MTPKPWPAKCYIYIDHEDGVWVNELPLDDVDEVEETIAALAVPEDHYTQLTWFANGVIEIASKIKDGKLNTFETSRHIIAIAQEFKELLK